MKHIFRIIIFSAGLFSTAFSQEKPADPEALKLFIEGKTYELQDNYIAAIEKYNQALKIEQAAGIYYTLSKMYYNVSQYKKALEYGLEALKKNPYNPDYQENVSDVYIILNDYKNALKYLIAASEKKPDDINILYNIGRIYEALKQPSEAIKYYERITEDFQYDEVVLQRMITIYESFKDYSNLVAVLEKLLSLNPTDLNIKYTLAANYLRIPDYEGALRIYEELLKLDPKNREVQTEIIKIFFRQGRNDLAFEKFGNLVEKDTVDFATKMGVALAFFDASKDDPSAVEVSRSILTSLRSSYPEQWMPEFYLAVIDIQEKKTEFEGNRFKRILAAADTSVEAYVQIGFLFYERNLLNDALVIFQEGADKFSSDFRLNYLTGNTFYRLGKEAESIPYLERGLEAAPSDLNTLSTLGIVYDNLKMDDKCDRLYQQAFKYHPDNILLMNNYAYHLAERGMRLEEALEMSAKTIEREPDNPSYLDTYGWIFFKLKDYRNALKYIEKAVRINPNSVLLDHLGDVYEAKGDIINALKHWNKSLEMDPDNKDVLRKVEKYR